MLSRNFDLICCSALPSNTISKYCNALVVGSMRNLETFCLITTQSGLYLSDTHHAIPYDFLDHANTCLATPKRFDNVIPSWINDP